MSGGLVRIASPVQLRVSGSQSALSAAEYYEAEAQAARDRTSALAVYYEHAAPARLHRARASGELTTTLLKRGEIATLFQEGRLPDGCQIVPARALMQKCRRIGADLPITASKELSAIRAAAWLAGDQQLVLAIDAAFDRATEEVVRLIVREGMVRARQGHADSLSRPAAEIAVIEVTHDVSRAGDPALHRHFVVVNGSIRADGTPATIDLTGIVENRFRLSAILSSHMAREMRSLGFGIDEVGHAGSGVLELTGLPDTLIECWSKRRHSILTEIERRGVGVQNHRDGSSVTARPTKARRELSQAVTLHTRGAKDALPNRAVLDERHRAEIQNAGTSPERMLVDARSAYSPSPMRRDVVAMALARLMEGSSTASLLQIRRIVAQVSAVLGWTLQQMTTAEEAVLDRMEFLGKDEAGRAVYATKEMIGLEHSFLRTVRAARGKGILRAESIEWAIEKLARDAEHPIMLTDEQKDALRHCARGDAVVAIRGVAGAGKTAAMRALTLAAARQGLRVISSAPTNRAATGLADEARTHAKKAVQGLRMAIEDGRGDSLAIGANTLLILDEAGMAEMRDAAVVVKYFRDRGAQILFLGDEKQFAPIGAGAPFRLLMENLGAAELKTIRRQAVGWQQQASLKAADGDSVALLRDYDAHGHLILADDRDEAFGAILRSYAADLASNPTATRLVLAQRHADVHTLNERIRAAEIAAGHLGQEEIVIPVLHRGGGKGTGIQAELRLRPGDILCFWTTLRDLGIDNGDRARLIGITLSDRQHDEPILHLRMEASGKMLDVRPRELVPPRRPGDVGSHSALPRLQHGYCSTLYSAQGVTVDRAWVYGAEGLDRESAYVGLTRHRMDCHVIYDSQALAMRLAEHGVSPSRPRLRESAITAATVARRKTCVADFVEDREYWLRTGEIRLQPPDLDRVTRIMCAAPDSRPASTQARLALAARARMHRQQRALTDQRQLLRDATAVGERRAARQLRRTSDLVASYNRRVVQRELEELQDRALTRLPSNLQINDVGPSMIRASLQGGSTKNPAARQTWHRSLRAAAAENADRAAARTKLIAGITDPLVVAIHARRAGAFIATLDQLRIINGREITHDDADAHRHQGRYRIDSLPPLGTGGTLTHRSVEPAPGGRRTTAGDNPAAAARFDNLRGQESPFGEHHLDRGGETRHAATRTEIEIAVDRLNGQQVRSLVDQVCLEQALIVPRIVMPVVFQLPDIMLGSRRWTDLSRHRVGRALDVAGRSNPAPVTPTWDPRSIRPDVAISARHAAQGVLAAALLERQLSVPAIPMPIPFAVPVVEADKHAAAACLAVSVLERELVVPAFPLPLSSVTGNRLIWALTASHDDGAHTSRRLAVEATRARPAVGIEKKKPKPSPSNAPEVAFGRSATKPEMAATALAERASRRQVRDIAGVPQAKSPVPAAIQEAVATVPEEGRPWRPLPELIAAFREARRMRDADAFLSAALEIDDRAQTDDMRKALDRELISRKEYSVARSRAAVHRDAQAQGAPGTLKTRDFPRAPRARGTSK